MGEMGGAVTYFYWSKRRTDRFLEDNGLEISPVTRTVTSPSLRAFPTFTRAATTQGGSRSQVAKLIEASLGQVAVTSFDAPGPIRYAKGVGSVVFGEYMDSGAGENAPRPAIIFTAEDYDELSRDSVAICLFGSMDNFAGQIQSAGPGFSKGWTCSNAPYVFDFLQARCGEIGGWMRRDQLVIEALKIATGQGSTSVYTSTVDKPTNIYKTTVDNPMGLDRPWRRGFTYGDVQDVAEWLAEIYLDADVSQPPYSLAMAPRYRGFRRVLIGAPLWIRTSTPRALRLYREQPPEELPAKLKW